MTTASTRPEPSADPSAARAPDRVRGGVRRSRSTAASRGHPVPAPGRSASERASSNDDPHSRIASARRRVSGGGAGVSATGSRSYRGISAGRVSRTSTEPSSVALDQRHGPGGAGSRLRARLRERPGVLVEQERPRSLAHANGAARTPVARAAAARGGRCAAPPRGTSRAPRGPPRRRARRGCRPTPRSAGSAARSAPARSSSAHAGGSRSRPRRAPSPSRSGVRCGSSGSPANASSPARSGDSLGRDLDLVGRRPPDRHAVSRSRARAASRGAGGSRRSRTGCSRRSRRACAGASSSPAERDEVARVRVLGDRVGPVRHLARRAVLRPCRAARAS